MESLWENLQERWREVRRNPRALAALGVVTLVAFAVAGFGAYRLLRPPEAGVLPLGPSAFEQGEIVVKFRPGAAADGRRSANTENRTTDIPNPALDKIGVSHLRIPAGSSVGEMVAVYERNPNVEYAQPNYLREAIENPNDPSLGSQWALTKIGAQNAWGVSTGTTSVILAVLDTGLDVNHADLKNWAGSAPTADDHGHGTLVAGLAAAATNNATGISSLCWKCTILSLKVLNATGSGSDTTIAGAIITAADAGAKVINMSFGGYSTTPAMQDAVNYAWGKGAILIAAAGNDNVSTPIYPAALNNVLSVGATDSSDAKATFSNFGAWVQVAAPGVNVGTTKMGGAYGGSSGTSMAAPIVSSLAGYLLSANPGLTNQEITSLIKQNSDQVAGSAALGGAGRINAQKAIAAAGGGTQTSAQVALPTATVTAAQQATATTVPPTATSVAPTATSTPLPPTPTPTPAPATATVAATAVPPTSTSTVAPTASPTTAPASSTAKTESFSGTVSANGTKQAHHTINVAAAGPITASLNWGGNPDLDLFLLNASNQEVAAATKSGKPAEINFNAPGPSTYTLRVVAVRGNNASYTLSTTHP